MLPPSCKRVIDILEGRGKVTVILHLLSAGTQRFSEIERTIRGISQRRLVQCLREPEADGIVRRVVHRQVPPRVDYSLTVWGRISPASSERFAPGRILALPVVGLPRTDEQFWQFWCGRGEIGMRIPGELPEAAFHAGLVAGIHHGLALLAAHWVAHQTFP